MFLRHSKKNILALLIICSCIVFSPSDIQGQEEQSLFKIYNQFISSSFIKKIDSLEIIVDNILFSNPDSAMLLADRIIEYSEEVNYFEGLACGLIFKARVYSKIRNDYLEALTLLLRAKRIIETHNIESLLNTLYLNLARAYFYTANFTEAEELYKLVLKRLEGTPPNSDYLDALNCLGIIYSEVKKDYPKSIKYYRLTLQTAALIGDSTYLGNAWNNLGELFLEKMEYVEAEKYFDTAEVVFRKLNDICGIALVKYNNGKLYFKQKQFSSAKNELSEGLSYAREIRSYDLIVKISYLLSEIYDQEGNFSEAYKYLKLHATAKDSFVNESKTRELLRVAFKSRIESEEERYQRILSEQEQANTKLVQQNWFIFIASLLIVVLGIVLIKLRSDNKEKEYINRLLQDKSNEVQEINARLNEINTRLEENNTLLNEKNILLSSMVSEKDNLMSILAHDLRNPLGSILSLTEIIEMEGDLNKDQQKFMGFLKNLANNSLRIIQDISDINQIESGKFESRTEIININNFFEEFLPAYIKIAQKKNITINFEASQQDITFDADPVILQRIFDNLISNAIKFSFPEKEVKIRVDDLSNSLCFAIIDQGQGFSEDDKKKMFLKFQKLSAKPTGNENSTGLGLTIVKTLVEKLHGTITVVSELGKGAEFKICLPKKADINS